MWFTLKLAWRNIFRNKRRTIIAGIAIGIGLAALIFSDALIIGMKDNMIRSATSSFYGEAQIHQQGFRATQEVEKTIKNLDWVVDELSREPEIEQYSLRTLSFGMLTSPANVNSIVLFGVEPESEQYLTKVDDMVKEGDFFKGGEKRDIVIGKKLAEILEVTIRDRVVVTVSQAHTGDLSQEMFRISGIYEFNVSEMDSGIAFVRLDIAQQMLGIGEEVHEIAIKFKDLDYAVQEDLPLWEKYSKDGNEIASWVTLLPELKAVFELTGISLFVLSVILFAIVTFGIINTLFMSIYERMFEFGVLRAVGTRSSSVLRLVVCEAGALAILSIILGIILGFLLTLIAQTTGIDYRGIEFAGATMHEILYPVLNIRQFIIYPMGVFIFTLFIGLYPARSAAKMSISDSLRKSM
jgi:ABC-type lipoprotein release transport system permease subunit